MGFVCRHQPFSPYPPWNTISTSHLISTDAAAAADDDDDDDDDDDGDDSNDGNDCEH